MTATLIGPGGTITVSGEVALDAATVDQLDDGLTDAQLRATPVPVSGTVSVVEPVTVDGTVSVVEPVTVDGTVTVANPGLTDAQLRATPVPVSGTVTVANPTADPETGLATEATVVDIRDRLPRATGTWGYHAGTAGTVDVATGARVVGIAAHAADPGATLTIAGGDAVPVPTGAGIAIAPQAQLVGPVDVTFTGTDSYFVEVVS